MQTVAPIIDGSRFQRMAYWRARCKPMPASRRTMRFPRSFSPNDVRWMAYGLLAEEIDARWVGLLEEGTLDFYRSWTGFHVYRLPLIGADDGARVAEVIINADPDQYSNTDDAFDRESVDTLLSWLLVEQPRNYGRWQG